MYVSHQICNVMRNFSSRMSKDVLKEARAHNDLSKDKQAPIVFSPISLTNLLTAGYQ